MSVVFLDTETTGLDSRTEDVFEVAIIGRHDEHVFRVRPRTAVVEAMHPKAAEVNRYHERTAEDGWEWDDPVSALDAIRGLLTGCHIVGAVPDFDTRHLTSLYWRFGQMPPRWHYHLIDVETLAVGYLLGSGAEVRGERVHLELPWKSDDLARACGIDPPTDDERHTALGDARWVKRWYERLTA